MRESDVKGHNYERKIQYSYSSGRSGDALDELLAIVSFAGFILFVLGLILRWEDTLWYIAVFLIPLVLLYVQHK
ncbi:MAG: hypothetical protein IJ043_11015 [Clostridia bacterium]|nr:hypothetical protein [Clostridia bacterium]